MAPTVQVQNAECHLSNIILLIAHQVYEIETRPLKGAPSRHCSGHADCRAAVFVISRLYDTRARERYILLLDPNMHTPVSVPGGQCHYSSGAN